MRLCKIIIRGFRQFENLNIDLTYPKAHPMAGEPLDKVCLMGLNGVGKTTLLKILRNALSNVVAYREIPLLVLKLKVNGYFLYTVHSKQMPKVLMFKDTIEQEEDWIEKVESTFNNTENFTLQQYLYSRYLLQGHYYNQLVKELPLKNNNGDLLIYSPAELGVRPNPDEVINAVAMRDAEHLFKKMPFAHRVSEQMLAEFWQHLIFQTGRRENLFKAYLDIPDNQDRKLRHLRGDFDQNHPHFLKKLAERWNDLLQPLGLTFNPDVPALVQPHDNLLPRVCCAQSGEPIDYSALSSSLRRLLFALGHIYALFYENKVKRGFVLLDGLDCHVHPSLVKKAFDTLLCTSDAQLFVTAHTSTLQGLFEPFEQVKLELTQNGKIEVE